ncbi:hypothetical protein V6N13_067262 [Hibiscus sabdariffa]|uniref:Uncharacterized protein n=1 Tax=Hibiscus sabdariffa TaxID=183260 RepID=A0ABR2DSW3_9ROSI
MLRFGVCMMDGVHVPAGNLGIGRCCSRGMEDMVLHCARGGGVQRMFRWAMVGGGAARLGPHSPGYANGLTKMCKRSWGRNFSRLHLTCVSEGIPPTITRVNQYK